MTQVGVLALQGDFEAHAKALEREGACAREIRRPEELADVDGLVLPGGETTTMVKLLRETGLWDAVAAAPGTGRPVFGTCAGLILLAREVTGPAQPSLGLLPVTVQRNAYGRQVDSFVEPGQVRVPADLASGWNGGAGAVPAAGSQPDAVHRPRATHRPDATHRPRATHHPRATHRPDATHRPRATHHPDATHRPDAEPKDDLVLPTEFVFIRAPRITALHGDVEVLARREGEPVLVRSGRVLGGSFHPELTSDGIVVRIFLAMMAQARAQRPRGNGGL